MQNQRQGSLTNMVGQSAHIHQGLDPISIDLTPSQMRWAAKFAAQGRAALMNAVLLGGISADVPPLEQDASSCAKRFQDQREADQPRRAAQQNLKTKQREFREARRERRPDQKPRWLASVDRWLDGECQELDTLIAAQEADAQAQRIDGMPASLEEAQRRQHAAQAARVSIQRIAKGLVPSVRPSAAEVAGDRLVALKPKRGKGAGTEGAGHLWHLLHLLGVYKAERQQHHPGATQEVLHSPIELLAAALRKSPKTISSWSAQLQAEGLIEARSHYTEDVDASTGEVVTRVDGTLYAVALQPGHTPRLTYGDLHHRYRDLTADRAGGRTAYRYAKGIQALWNAEKNMSESTTSQRGGVADPTETVIRILQQWAVTPGGGADLLDPRYSFDPDIFREDEKTAMQTVIYDLPLIADEQHTDRRRVLVHHTAGSIAAALGDAHSRAHYASLIWEALKQGWRGLQALAAQLARFEVDRREWGSHMRHAPALLTRRIRQMTVN